MNTFSPCELVYSAISLIYSIIAYTDGGKINFEKGQYTRNLFGYYKDEIAKGNKDNIVVVSGL